MRRLKNLYYRIRNYIYDSSINIKERTFVVFSTTVLVALFLAIPTGIMMHEPLSATLSTAVGAVTFSIYIYIVFKKNLIAHAKIVISHILVFLFLPAMFFTNGGALGGAPIWLLLGIIYISLILEGTFRNIMLIADAVVMIICWLVGYFNPGLITEYSRGGNFFDSIAALLIVSAILFSLFIFQNSLLRKEEEQKNVQRLFAQTATALVNAIDAKDEYTHGHSARVAEYSRKIAEMAGKSPEECEEIYYVALLHDVGKIGISESIINKEGRLTDEEYAVIKQHPVLGAQILQSITEYPYISLGAHFHHERYDGKGYPQNLKGTDIPEVARIIAVADSYDAMTSKRSYRDPIPQETVREELIEGSGTQFDPEFANIMLHLVDLDTEYEMKERGEIRDFAGRDELVIGEHRSYISEGIVITPNMTTITMRVKPDKKGDGHTPMPSIVVFDSLDGIYHNDEKDRKDLLYFEYAEILFSGTVHAGGIRKHEMQILSSGDNDLIPDEYRIEAVKYRDHALINIKTREKTVKVIMALPDSTRYVYIGLTGTHCRYSHVVDIKAEETIGENFIPRIAKEISFIDGPVGDVPNVQVDGYRSSSSVGIPVDGDMTITFHTKCLPTARLVWHCPSYVLYTADDKVVYGKNYQEMSLVRLDGENWEAHECATCDFFIEKKDFHGWDAWKKYNQEGYDCRITFKVNGNIIESVTENAGISIKNVVEVTSDIKDIYVALSGDQVALTNIRIQK